VQAKLAHSQLFQNSALPAVTPRVDPRSEQLAGNSNVELASTLLWGLLAVALGVAVFFAAARLRRQRWYIYGGGVLVGLVLLWFFFGAVSPLLPASY
jgi:hypothetical protein